MDTTAGFELGVAATLVVDEVTGSVVDEDGFGGDEDDVSMTVGVELASAASSVDSVSNQNIVLVIWAHYKALGGIVFRQASWFVP